MNLSVPIGILQGMPVLDRPVSIDEAVDLFGVPRSTLYRWARRGWLTPVEAGRGRGCKGRVSYFLLSDVATAVAERRPAGGRR